MDYDDNDFQSQNIHLAGEGSNKYPPVLQPYALPKFDFDDSLNRHLRFDSLVETEVFLGIEGSKDNHWIEDFSRGSSGVVFGTTEAESCAISRHNNVWSEATSSESVEMLLKSVGQDEVITGETTAKESDACDELGCITKQMDSSQKRKESNLYEEVTINLQPILSTDKTSGDFPGFKEDVGQEQPLDRDASQTSEHESSMEDKSSILGPRTVSEDTDITLKLRNESGDVEQTSLIQNKIDAEVSDSKGKREQEDHSESGMQVVVMDISLQNVSTGISELNYQNILQLKSNTDDGLQASNSNSKEEVILIDDPSKDGKSVAVETHLDNPICLTAKVESIEKENVSHIADSDVELKGLSDFHVVEGGRECFEIPAEAGRQKVLGLCTDLEPLSQDFQVSSAHVSSTVEPAVELVGQATYRGTIVADETAGWQSQHTEIVGNKPEGTFSSLEENKDSERKDDTSITSYVGGSFSSNLGHSSSELLREPVAAGTSEVGDPTDTTDESTKICYSDKVAKVSDVDESGQCCPVGNMQSTVSSSDCCNLDHNACGSVTTVDGIVPGSISTGAGQSASKLADSKSQSDSIEGDKSGTVTDQRQLQTLSAPAEEFKQLAKEDATAGSIPPSADVSMKTSSGPISQLGPVSGSEKGASRETGAQFLSEKADQTLPIMDVCNSGSQSGQQAAKLNKDCKGSSHSNEVCPAASELKETEGRGVDGQVAPQKPKEAILQEKCEPGFQKLSEPITDGDMQQSQPKTLSLECPSSGTGKKVLKYNNSTSSGEDMYTEIAIPSTKSDSFKVGGSSDAFALSESPAKSHISEGGKVCTELENFSFPLPTVVKTSGAPQCETGTNSVRKPNFQDIPSSSIVDSQNPKRNDASSGGRSFPFDVTPLADLSVKKGGKNSPPVAPVLASTICLTAAGSASTPNLEKMDVETSKGTPECKTRRKSRVAGKETSKKRNAAKEAIYSGQLQSGSKTSIALQISLGAGQIVQSIEKQQHTHVETTNIRPFGTFSTTVTSLPDLNSSALSAVFQRTFTDLQQVQLRAQIFVYGALIQGTAPDEAYMLSAFGGPDGGKSSWENAWRACLERTKTSHVATLETPLQSCSGFRAPDQAMKSALQGKMASPSIGQASGRNASAVRSIIALSSPLWSTPAPHDTSQSISTPKGPVTDHRPVFSSLHPHQTPPVKNHIGHSTPWIPPSPYCGPWVASPQSNAFDTGARFSVIPITQAVKLMPVKESFLPHSGVKHLPKDPIVQSGTSSSFTKGTSMVDPTSIVVSPAQSSTDRKRRKRKKLPVSEEPSHINLHSQPQTEPVSAPVITSHVSTCVSITTPANLVSESAKEKLVTSSSRLPGGCEIEQRSMLSEETIGKLNEARMHAEDATVLAAAAVSSSEYVWKQIEQQKNSGLEPEIQSRLASAAIAIAAAAAVAKAAAAAANVASNAALQAKLMAEEASASDTFGRGNEISTSDGIRTFGQATPASILKGDSTTVSSSLVLTAAREAARKRVESASAATKQAENMDAVVKAAELAAEAVSQAEKLVTMGDPLSLNELVETGPDYYSTHTQSVTELEASKGGILDKKETLAINLGISANPREMQTELEDHGVSGSVSAAGKKIEGQKGHKGIDLAKPVVMASDSEAVSKSSINSHTENEQNPEASKENGIKEGSLVEVFKEGAGLRKAWYTAIILSLTEGKAFVSYNEIPSEKGAEKLKEWVDLEDERGEEPKIRIARRITAIPFEGTRKRRRATTGDYTWAVGDSVDAWVHDSWWEGIVTEKNKKDETTLTVNFPAQGETLTVKAWHLRPSLFWRDGKWMEWSSARGSNSSSHEGDTPNVKRARLVSPAHEAKGNSKSSKNVDLLESVKPHQPVLLELAASDRTFNIGRSTRDENKRDPLGMKRTGIQKQGSRVIFGVPKPGKKRKFMEVSKHYVSDPSSKAAKPNDTVKSTKYLMPQASGSRGWGKSISKSNLNEKQAAVSKPKVFKSKPKEKPSASVRTISQKEDSQNTAASDVDADAATNQRGESKGSVSHNTVEFKSASGTGDMTEDQTCLSSHDVSEDVPSSKKTSSLSSKAECANKGKLASAAGRLAKIEEEKALSENSIKSASDNVEPRRSNRKIQPTSRLLEGLQSSMVISKVPSVLHGKGHQSLNKSSSRGK